MSIEASTLRIGMVDTIMPQNNIGTTLLGSGRYDTADRVGFGQ
jgi:hypothetical protein